jgi:ribosome biogenesis GTPase
VHSEECHSDGSDILQTGMVIKKSTGQYFVKVDERLITCTISSKLRKRLIYPIADPASIRPHVVAVKQIRAVDPVAIGDLVNVRNYGNASGVIVEVLPRKNKLSRRAAGRKPLEQILISNVDMVVMIVSTAKPKPKWRLLDRYIADAEAAEIDSLICITKVDLVDELAIRKQARIYENIGYTVVYTSALKGDGIEALRDILRGKISIFIGKSGVGKTTLLNAMQTGLGLRVQEVSAVTGKGKHTTSHLEMFELDSGGFVVDTPGMREFGIWAGEDISLASLFREMRPYLGRCKFGSDCSHSHEPGCAVKGAVEKGDIEKCRYESYLRMLK